MTKKYIYILFSITFVTLIVLYNKNNEVITNAFLETYDDYDYNTVLIEFDECKLSTNNFINKLSYFNDKDYIILEIIPYVNESYKYVFSNKKFLFYSNNLNYILNKFKNEYIDVMIENDSYVTNICIKGIRMNISNIDAVNFG